MYAERLSLTDFRSYAQLDLELSPGATVLVGQNGVGKTNLVEALGMLSTLSSHRVSSDAPLVRFGAERALVRAAFVRGTQRSALELEINPGRANRGRINRGATIRARDLLGIARTVLFAPEDLALVKGDPSSRRRFLDELLTVLLPHLAGTRADYDRVLKQRNALLKSARAARFSRRGGPDARDASGGASVESTLEVWDTHLAQAGARLLAARVALVGRLAPHLDAAYAQLTDGSKVTRAVYRSSVEGAVPDAEEDADDAGHAPSSFGEPPAAGGSPGLAGLGVDEIAERFLAALAAARPRELERGLTLVGPHRDDLELLLGEAPAKGFASHGETWSFALALRLASYYVMLDDSAVPGDEPILILDDVFAELDATRRARLAAIVAKAEQVLVTAAVDADIPPELGGRRIRVFPGAVDDGDAARPEHGDA
ncbi:DNA replication/repair protein RecF [Sinomonas atrocyanea]|uniref:DNA replication/repair protein RecF n=1 Tax=Sinomonas atrocyanea TaxID=37927 RepID=UPI00277D2D91|nr:DNA replication/repair protein RecF [Sinomonas atrocyanea]MDQ0260755.1 DNA replication and repair protein RecF [Sinomonas atrocyanea]MDR6622262.1 DNA replication and repair protein RecF [Sinomonas atrocyanea]